MHLFVLYIIMIPPFLLFVHRMTSEAGLQASQQQTQVSQGGLKKKKKKRGDFIFLFLSGQTLVACSWRRWFVQIHTRAGPDDHWGAEVANELKRENVLVFFFFFFVELLDVVVLRGARRVWLV